MKFATAVGLLVCALPLLGTQTSSAQTRTTTAGEGVIQQPPIPFDLVFCVDTSGSMKTAMERAKQFIVESIRGYQKYSAPKDLRVGLLIYGLSNTAKDASYEVRPLTDNLDSVQEGLEKIEAGEGGAEPVGTIIKLVTDKMNWRQGTFKAVYFLGNETADQGTVDYRTSASTAGARGIHMNAVYYGAHFENAQMQNYQPGDEIPAPATWMQIAALGKGHFFLDDPANWNLLQSQIRDKEQLRLRQINQEFNARMASLYGQFAGTYLPYDGTAIQRRGFWAMGSVNGSLGGRLPREIQNPDALSPIFQELTTDHSKWDLVDAVRRGIPNLDQIQDGNLPPEMQDMDAEERNSYVANLFQRRTT